MSEYKITKNISNQDIAEIYSCLKDFNLSKLECSEVIPLGIFKEDASENKLAGLIGETFGNWLSIKYLWVSAELRGKGIGSVILQAAENEARLRGAKYAFVDTFSFQAPKFYVRHGYKQVFELTDYPYTGSRYYYIKNLWRKQ